MRKIHFLFLFCICFQIHAYRPSSSRLYVSSDVYFRNLKQHFLTDSKSKDAGFLKGYQIGYDFIKANSLYLGADFYQNKNKTLEKNKLFIDPDIKNQIKNYEIRGGLTLSLISHYYFTSYIAWGKHYLDRDLDDDVTFSYKSLDYSWVYLGIGVKATLLTTSYWDLCINVKVMELIKASVYIKPKNPEEAAISFSQEGTFKAPLGKKLQYAIEAPVYLYLGQLSPFDLAIIPYYKDLETKQGNDVGVFEQKNIYAPSTKTYEIGIRLEMGLFF